MARGGIIGLYEDGTPDGKACVLQAAHGFRLLAQRSGDELVRLHPNEFLRQLEARGLA